jgi:hypothetical protein
LEYVDEVQESEGANLGHFGLRHAIISPKDFYKKEVCFDKKESCQARLRGGPRREEGEVKQTKESAEVNDAQFLMGSFQTGKHCVPKQNDTYHACLKSRARKNRLCSCIDFKEQI